MANGLFGGGTGTELDPFLVEDVADLKKIAEHYSGPIYNGEDYHYLQVNDIDMAGENFYPIGDTNIGVPFMGTYDGNNYVIENLTINNDSTTNVGLFSLTSGATFKNVRIKNANIKVNGDGQYAGVLAGILGGTVENCEVEGKVTGLNDSVYLGGIAGSVSSSELINCRMNVDVAGVGRMSAAFYNSTGNTFVNLLVAGSVKTLSEGAGSVYLFPGSKSDTVVENCIITTKIIDIEKFSYVSMWEFGNEDTNFIGAEQSIEQWKPGIEYPYGRFVVGTDGNVYKNFRPQEVSPVDDDTGEPINVQPIVGEHWESRWQLATVGGLINNEQLKDPSTFVGWDFENVWTMGPNGPELQAFYTPSEEPEDNEDIPSDIEIVTDVNFAKTKMLRDKLGTPIPQVWDHENQRWVPVTLQMILFMANS